MNHFAVIVSIKLKPGTAEDFYPHIIENAAASTRNEPDCHRFDVVVAEDDNHELYFYEEYTDAAAFEAHRNTPHYETFRQATDDMVLERVVHRCNHIG